MRTILIIVLSFISITISCQDLIVEGKVGIGTTTIGKALEVYGNVVTKATSVGGTAGAFTAGTDGLVSFWTNGNYNPANPGSGWKRTMNMIGGNVGIGTTNPQSRLHVTENYPGEPIIRGVNSDHDDEDSWGIYGDGSNGIYGIGRKSDFGIGVFGISSAGAGQGVWGKSTGGNGVGVYGQSPDNIGVYGSSAFHIGVRGSGGFWDFWADHGSYGNSSSRRWKNNVMNIPSPLGKLAKLRGVYFDWDKEHGGKHSVGFIAEEVGAVLPEIVEYEENGVDAKGMDYSKMTPLLVEAANAMRAEYQDKFEKQQLEIDALANEIAELRAFLKTQLAHSADEE